MIGIYIRNCSGTSFVVSKFYKKKTNASTLITKLNKLISKKVIAQIKRSES